MAPVFAAALVLALAEGAGEGSCGCSTPSRASGADSRAAGGAQPACTAASPRELSISPPELVDIPGGEFVMGTDTPGVPGDGEAPARRVRVSPFRIGRTEVSNRQWSAFVNASGHVSDAEAFGWSFVFEGHASEHALRTSTQAVAGTPWWIRVDGASWREPFGRGSDALSAELADHPVVHVSWRDAAAYCAHAHAGGRLPTEAEWERAARGGVDGQRFPWGDELKTPPAAGAGADGPRRAAQHRCNVWQGRFPREDRARDGYSGSAPVGAYAAQNGFGLHNMIGNVWEWVADGWGTEHARPAPSEPAPLDPLASAHEEEKVKKGGSFLCHSSYCFRYRTAARSHNSADSSASNLGFRCAQSAELPRAERE